MEILLGALVSLFVQFTKKVLGGGEFTTLLWTLCVSTIAAAIYVYLTNAGLWESVVQIMTIAGAIYTFIISRFTEGSTFRKMIG